MLSKTQSVLVVSILIATQTQAMPTEHNGALTTNCHVKRITAYSRPRIFIYKNKTDQTVLLNQASSGEGMQAGWVSSLDSGKVSAMVLQSKRFALTCSINNQPVSCKDAVDICQVTSRISNIKPGSYWLLENKSWDQFTQQLSIGNLN